jgi:hypothetical protein
MEGAYCGKPIGVLTGVGTFAAAVSLTSSPPLVPDVRDLLGAWWGECGRPKDDVLVFSNGRGRVPYWAFYEANPVPGNEAAEPPHGGSCCSNPHGCDGPGWTRTTDQRIMSPLL